jgi:L-ascorbate metabolism protein UlaG (beta-lactamase superfamily)
MVVSIKWLAHASFQIKSNGKIIYIDMEKHGEAFEKADLILVTHSHSDHCDPEKIKLVQREDTVIVAPKDCVAKLEGSVKSLSVGEEFTLDDVSVRAIEAHNIKRFRSPGIPYHPKGYGVGHAGDTDFLPEMQHLGHVDVALLPTGDTYTMDNVEAAEATIVINPTIVIPMHCWSTKREDFKARVEAKSNIKVMLLREGEEVQVTN